MTAILDDAASPEPTSAADRMLLLFDRLWCEGARPCLEHHLVAVEPEDRPALLEELLLVEWRHRRGRGEPLTAGEYARRFPAWPEVLRVAWDRWERLAAAEDAGCAGRDTLEPACWLTQGAAGPGAEPPPEPAGYEVLQRLGEGGMGVVYRAFDRRLKRSVALKALPDGAAPERLALFRREAEALARLQHPHVVQLFAWDEHDGRPVLVLEYVPGGTLEGRLGQGRLPPREAARLVVVLARAVQAAHKAGVVHRDLKPANVLLAEPVEGYPGNACGGLPKIADFGLARLAGSDEGRPADDVAGTPAYMAPEQAGGRPDLVGPPADVWALGVILYRCLSGRLPFAGDGVARTLQKVKCCPPPALRQIEPSVPAALEAICLACLDKDPARRPGAGELAWRLEGWLAEPAPAPPRRRPRRALTALAGLFAPSRRGSRDLPPALV
jgi:serine/threonine protein kinase